jgi:hypothetical protein
LHIKDGEVRDSLHAEMAKGLLNEILCNPYGKEGKALPKALNLLKLVTSTDRPGFSLSPSRHNGSFCSAHLHSFAHHEQRRRKRAMASARSLDNAR